MPVRVDLIAAARPNFMKVAPLFHVLSQQDWCTVRLVHTGQHYDANMSDSFFRDFSLPTPDIHLEIGSGSHAEQTGRVMIAYEQVLQEQPADWTIVVGDVNSTFACAMAAVKLGIRVAHLEAGLRSRDRTMPEEINRLATDAIVDLLWTPSSDADDNLLAEGVARDKIDFVGNIMLDSFELVRERIAGAGTQDKLGLSLSRYGIVTLHRPSNVDDPSTLRSLVEQLVDVSERLPLVFAVHPRTRARLEAAGLLETLEHTPGVHLIEPQGYIDFMNLVTGASLAITDSGGIQEETTYLGIPCLTLRRNTERPITLTEGTNRLLSPTELSAAVDAVLAEGLNADRPRPQLWDGQAAGRIADSLRKHALA
ncbi:UDP-N-acetylglucosamine 2-epimerase (non-hydrolyzing) [Salinisphaera sp. T31B1]|uniref:non-hydrolyzing UDP-N-acetylglucosamine 2-epimerase n=1 Tax=Salinisphaera sp. T31B1 TaxID=727963 RepID=UPI003340DE64